MKGNLDGDTRCFTCDHGPHKNEKLCERDTREDIRQPTNCSPSPNIHLPMLKRLPRVNRAANFRDFSTITGVRASAWGERGLQELNHTDS